MISSPGYQSLDHVIGRDFAGLCCPTSRQNGLITAPKVSPQHNPLCNILQAIGDAEASGHHNRPLDAE